MVTSSKVNRTAEMTKVEACRVDETVSIKVDVEVVNVGPVGNDVNVVKEVKENRSVTVNVMGWVNVVTVEKYFCSVLVSCWTT